MAITPNTSANVDTGRPKAGGYAFWAPVETPIPADTATPIADPFINLGYISKDGISWTPERETTDHEDWLGDVVETTQDSYSETWTVTFLESLRGDLLKRLHGSENVNITPPTTDDEGKIEIKGNSLELEDGVFVFDMKTRKSSRRPILPNAKIASVGEVKFVTNELIAYTCTIKTKPDAQGNHSYQKIGLPRLKQ